MKKREVGVLFCALVAAVVRATPVTWTGAVDANWHEAGNWDNTVLPAVGDDVVIPGGAVLLAAETPLLASFTLNGGTVTISNWMTRLQAETITLNSGTVTLPEAFTETAMSNRVWLAASQDFTLGTDATIDADGCGYRNLNGPGKGVSYRSWCVWTQGSGAGHAGRGGRANNTAMSGEPYGRVVLPEAPGSGCGGEETGGYGFGGGAVRIDAGGTVTIDGAICANGRAGTGGYNRAGGGSGGSIWITGTGFGGAATGQISADGGNAAGTLSGAGAGGRIAVHYITLADPCAVRFSAVGGTNGWADNTAGALPAHFHYLAAWGSLYFPDVQVLESGFADSRLKADIFIGQGTTWKRHALQVTNTVLRLASPDLTFQLTNTLTVGAAGDFRFYGTNLMVGADVTVETGGTLTWVSGSNLPDADFGQQVLVNGTLSIASNATVWIYSEPNSGGSPLIQADVITVAAGGQISALARGFGGDKGPGAGTYQTTPKTGSGYGGSGGCVNYTQRPGASYGSVDNPLLPGSGGSGGFMRSVGGGGLIRLEAGTITLDGSVAADGGNVLAGGGGASGGAINIRCETLGGDGGVLSVQGGNGSGEWQGGGGGGRMALHYNTVSATARLAFCAAPGASWANANPDALGWFREAGQGTLFLSDASFLSDDMSDGRFVDVRLVLSNQTSWTATDHLILKEGRLTFEGPGFNLIIPGDLSVENAWLGLGPSGTLHVAGDVLLTNSASLRIDAGTGTLATDAYGALAEIGGTLHVAPGCWVYPQADSVSGASPLFRLGGLLVAEGGGIKAIARGFAPGSGPGFPTITKTYLNSQKWYGGGGNGGHGGNANTNTSYELIQQGLGGGTNGLDWMPLHPGSGGNTTYRKEQAGRGGGAIRLDVNGTVLMDGSLNADAGHHAWNVNSLSTGGAGGSILVRCCGDFSGGSNAVLCAQGGDAGGVPNSSSGGGGGGRIAIWQRTEPDLYAEIAAGTFTWYTSETALDGRAFKGSVDLDPGQGWRNTGEQAAEPGTLFILTVLPPGGTIFLIR